ncbi:hypothetical protein WG922_06260 [Ramlibacter sp. AN1015]|uniref:hypothetical protein n=1 Tax=Ramlibacter sp. AN1015 TaxID=3133428 RepID=UPI0030C1E246
MAAAQDGDPPAAARVWPTPDLILLAHPADSLELAPLNWAQRGTSARAQALKLGLQWKGGSSASGWQVDATVWRRVSADNPADALLYGRPAQARYGAGLEMQLPQPKRLSLRDLLGVQLDNGARLSLGRKNGAVRLYYKVQF